MTPEAQMIVMKLRNKPHSYTPEMAFEAVRFATEKTPPANVFRFALALCKEWRKNPYEFHRLGLPVFSHPNSMSGYQEQMRHFREENEKFQRWQEERVRQGLVPLASQIEGYGAGWKQYRACLKSIADADRKNEEANANTL